MILVANVLEEGAFGGPQRRSVLVANELKLDERVTTTLIFDDTAAELASECAKHSIAHSTTPLVALSKKPRLLIRYMIRFLPQTIALSRLLRKVGADVVHVSGGAFCFSAPAAAGLAKIPYIWHLNDTDNHASVRATFWLMSRIFRPASVIYAAHAVEDYYGDLVPRSCRTDIVAAPFRPDVRTPTTQADPFPERTSPDEIRILLLANINPIKGHEVAVDAMAKLAKRCPTAHLFVAGGTKESQKALQGELLERVAKSGARVTYLGGRSDIAELLNYSDMSICSSHAEASPLAVWEAAGAGNAIASSDVGDVERVLGDAALIVPVGDADALAAAIERLASDEELRLQLGGRAANRVVGKLDVASIAELTADVYCRAAPK